jgi:hypothetical protein
MITNYCKTNRITAPILLDKKISFLFKIAMEHSCGMLLLLVILIYINIDSSLKLCLSIEQKHTYIRKLTCLKLCKP